MITAPEGAHGRAMREREIEKIRDIVAKKAERFRSRMGDVALVGVEDGTVKIAPTGYCWR